MRVLIAALVAGLFFSGAQSAEIGWVPDSSDTIRDGHLYLEGEIEVGDFAKLKNALDPDGDGRFGRTTIYLDSAGGNFEEAMEIADFIQKVGLYTYVGDGAKCYSSCLNIFMHGTEIIDGVPFIARTLHPNGILGFHATYDESIQQWSSMLNARVASATLLKSFLKTDSTDLLMIDTVGEALALTILLEHTKYTIPVIKDEHLLLACHNIIALDGGAMPTMRLVEAQERVASGERPRMLGATSGVSIEQVAMDTASSEDVICNFGLRPEYTGASVFFLGTDPEGAPNWEGAHPLSHWYFMEGATTLSDTH